MLIAFSTLDRAARDTVMNLAVGYEADARAGISRQSQADRLLRWRNQGWDARVYYYNILAMMIGYRQAAKRAYQTCMPGFEGFDG
jgi:hypothetical protein